MGEKPLWGGGKDLPGGAHDRHILPDAVLQPSVFHFPQTKALARILHTQAIIQDGISHPHQQPHPSQHLHVREFYPWTRVEDEGERQSVLFWFLNK